MRRGGAKSANSTLGVHDHREGKRIPLEREADQDGLGPRWAFLFTHDGQLTEGAEVSAQIAPLLGQSAGG